jgi:hypothetical protein
MRGINVTWSFGWNGANAAETATVRAASNRALGDAVRELFSFG